MKKIIIKENDANQRIDRFLSKYMDKAPTNFIQKMLRKKRIKLNGKRAHNSDVVKINDEIKMYLSEETINKFQSNDYVENVEVNLDIIYEDSNIILINKKAGQIAHSANKEKDSIVEQMQKYLYDKGEYNPKNEKTFKPAICNRLDINTYGIIIGAKNYKTLKQINKSIRDKYIKKLYKAIVVGCIKNKKELHGYLLKDNKNNKVKIYNDKQKGSKEVLTNIYPIKYNEKFSLIEIDLITGRTHQIRAHLSSIGNPIIGDKKYGLEKTNQEFKLKGQYLVAYQITFNGLTDDLSYLNGKTFMANIDNKLNELEKILF